jgi:hypothetical protein
MRLLIQEFSDPPDNPKSAKIGRVFGGGALGLSDQAWDILDEIFTIRYMGAAEYERGALPKALHAVFEAKDSYVSGRMTLKPFQFRGHWKRSSSTEDLPKRKAQEVLYICLETATEQVKEIIIQVAKNKAEVKNGCHFPEALDPLSKEDSEYKGWLDLQNKFFFFTDKTMHDRICQAFGITVITVTEENQR